MCEQCVKEVHSNHHSLDGGYPVNISQFNRKVFCQQYTTIGRNFYGYTGRGKCGDKRIQVTCGKKRIEDQKRQDHYDLLKTRFFIPIRNINYAAIDANDPQDWLKLAYGFSRLAGLPDYDYAKQHMDQDLPKQLIKPEALQLEVRDFNLDINDFFNNKIPKIIENTLHSKLGGVNIINSVDSLPDNSMSYHYLMQKLNRFWVQKQDVKIEIKFSIDLFKLDGGIDLAKIPISLEHNLKSAVSELKASYQIKTYINFLRDRRTGIIEQINALPESINTEIISKIEHQQYKTRCSGCTKY